MAENSPQAGRYRITVASWDRIKNGVRTRYRKGDEVDLDDYEARRLAGSRHFPSAVKVEEEESSTSTSSTSSSTTGTSSTSTRSKSEGSEKK